MNAENYMANLSHEQVDYDPFALGALSVVVPTTEPQREIWLADQLGREASLAFNLSVSLRFHGVLDVACLRSALQRLVDRHDALRANVGPDGESLCVREHMDMSMPIRDLSALDDQARQAEMEEFLRQSTQTPFAIATDPLLRAELLRTGIDEHLLLLTAHHVICDGWSWWLIVRELGALYSEGRADAHGRLPDPASFAEYALGDISHSRGESHAADEAYWLSRFSVDVPVLELPTDHSRPSERSFASAREDHVLDAALVEAVRNMGAQRGATLFSTLLAGFSGLLSRLSGQSDVVVGIPAAGQPVAGYETLIGHCVNLLPLRFTVDPAAPFSVAIDAAQATLLDALEHQRYTFGTLLKRLRVRRDPARTPLVSVLFNLDQSVDEVTESFSGLAIEYETNPRTFETFELFVNAVRIDGALRLQCQYNRALFDGATIRQWLRAFDTLLRAAVERTEAQFGSLPLVDEVGLMELASLQPAPVAFDRERRMHEYFEGQCDRTPDRIAVRFGADTCRYAALEDRANRITHLLRRHGVHRGSLVGVALDRSVDMLATLLAVLKSGAGYVPLDPQFPQDRLAYMAADAGLALLVTTREHASRFDLRGRPILRLDALVDELAAAANSRIGRDELAAEAEDVAYTIYTSGSTGRPKGVMVPHRGVSNFLASMKREPGLVEKDRLLAVTTLSFDIAVLELLLPLSVGAEVVLADRDTASDGHGLAALLASSQATVMQATPSTWRLLLDAGWHGTPDFKALCGGEALAPDLARMLLPRCGALWNLYGPTETTVWSTCTRITPHDLHSDPGIGIGRPIANTSVWILDALGVLCPRGVPGEIWIGGAGVTLGYLDRPELNAERFVVDGFAYATESSDDAAPQPMLYRTGDRGRWRPDGTLEHLGRLDHQVKVRGYRIELGEIEANLAAREDVARALVVVREDQPNDQRLVAYLVMKDGAGPEEATMRMQMRDVLPAYMVPQHFIRIDALPLLPNGKIDRSALPLPRAVQPRVGAPAEQPAASRDPRVSYLADVWSELLGATAGANDNFFDLGGHSMLAVQMANRVARDTGVHIKLIRLGTATLEQIASDLPVQSQATTGVSMGKRIGQGLSRIFGARSVAPKS